MLSMITQILNQNFESDYVITYTLVEEDEETEEDAAEEEEEDLEIETRDGS